MYQHEFIIPHIIRLNMLKKHELIVNSELNTFVIALYGKKGQKARLTFQSKDDACEADKTLTKAITDKKEYGVIEVDFDLSFPEPE